MIPVSSYHYNSPSSYEATPSVMKNGLIIEVASLEGDSLVVFYFRRVSEIWHDKMVGFWHEGLERISSSYSVILLLL